MANVLIVAYLLIVVALIGVILVQRSEGGGLGMGGGGNFMTARGSANLLTRTTAVLAALFFATAIGLTILNEVEQGSGQSILDQAAGANGEKPSSVLDALNSLQQQAPGSETTGGTQQPAPAPETQPSAPAEDALDLAVPTPPAADGSAAPAPDGGTAPGTTSAPAGDSGGAAGQGTQNDSQAPAAQ